MKVEMPRIHQDVLVLENERHCHDLADKGTFVFLTAVGTVRMLRPVGQVPVSLLQWGFITYLSAGFERPSFSSVGASFVQPSAYRSVKAALERGREVHYFNDARKFCRWMADNAFVPQEGS